MQWFISGEAWFVQVWYKIVELFEYALDI